MKRLRTHIIRLTVAVLVWTGFSLYMVQSAQADHTSQSFANWLDELATSLDGSELQKKLDDLNGSTNLEKTIQEASHILSRNAEDLDFPFAESMASQQLYQLLFIEWSYTQSANTMDSVPVKHISKLSISATIDKSGIGGFITEYITAPDTSFSKNIQLVDGQQLAAMALEPMVNCIAIGAP